eukprot:scaffold5311_cov120-Isochrysis_galbana.AAC.4
MASDGWVVRGGLCLERSTAAFCTRNDQSATLLLPTESALTSLPMYIAKEALKTAVSKEVDLKM